MRYAIKRYLKAHPALRMFYAPALPLLRSVRLRRERALSRIYDQFFEHLTGTVTLRVSECEGSFETDCRSHVAKRVLTTGSYEPEVAELIKRYIDPHKDAIDVGANVGIFTVLMSSLLSPSNRVLAIEPSPSARVLLARNLARSGYAEKVLVFEGAATATAGQFTIHTIPGLEEYSSLTEIVHFSVQNRSSQSLPIVGQPIDVLVDRFGLRPGIIKIDTEGAEFAVLSGAMNTLKMLRPIVVTEVYDPMLAKHGATSQMLVELLRAQAYSVVRFEFPEILAIPEELRCPEHAL